MASTAPLVTIAIPTLNRSGFLRLAVQSALAQDYGNIEVLVSDNASDDDTADVLESLLDERLRVLQQPSRLAMYPHWNRLVMAAHGEYFLLLSDDDVLEPNAISMMVRKFEQNPSAGIVVCHGTAIDSDGHEIIPGKRAPQYLGAEDMILSFFRSELDLWPCSLLFRLSDLKDGYPEGFPLGADAALWMQVVAKHGNAAFIPITLTRYRVHRNTTNTVGFVAWQSENSSLARFAIAQLQASGRGSPTLFRKLIESSKMLNVRITAGLIVKSAADSRIRATYRLVRHVPQFLSPYGAVVLLKSMIEVFVPKSWRYNLVQLSRSIKHQL